MKADYPLRFINSVSNEFIKGKDHRDKSFIILLDLFGITKYFISSKIPYCELNETILKNESNYKLCVFHRVDCCCGSSYIVETKRNAEVT